MSDPFGIAREIDIVDLVSNKYGIDCALSGRIVFASCPLTNGGDSNPSFAIYPNENRFHCYHCGDWFGTPIDFVMRIENLDSPMAALRHLDKLYPELGVISENGRSRAELVGRYFGYTDKTATDDHANLTGNARLMEWITSKRGFSARAIDQFNLGMRQFGEIPRLTIPQTGTSGRVLGFVTRKVSPIDTLPRYYTRNVSLHHETGQMIKKGEHDPDAIPVFIKGQYLYNLDRVKSRDVCVVEGHLDVVAAWELGVDNVVANGTKKLTDDQVALLTDFDSVTLIPDLGAFDSVLDNTEIIRGTLPHMPIRVVDLSMWADATVEGQEDFSLKDVNDMLIYLSALNDPQLFKTAVDCATLVEEWLYHHEVAPLLSNHAKAIPALDRVMSAVHTPAAKARLAQLAAEGLGIPAELLLLSR